jgi:uncharacterized membrane protein
MTPAERQLLRMRLRVSLWPAAVLLTALSIVLAELVSLLADDTARSLLFLPDFGADTARSVLSAIATGMLAFTGLVSAVILLALQFGASQLSPRLLRSLVGQSPAKWALGISIGAFVYTLLVIGEVAPQGRTAEVPALAVQISILLVLAAIASSLHLLQVTVQSLRVAGVTTKVATHGLEVVARAYPHPVEHGDRAERPVPSGDPQIVAWHGPPGVIAAVVTSSLVAEAARRGQTVELIPAVGDGMEPGAPLMRVWGGGVVEPLMGTIVITDERTYDQDPMFALRILVDIAIRALSPAVNDPTTAVQCLHRIEALLSEIAGRGLEAGVHRDDSGVVRVVLLSPSWDDFLDLGLSEIRHAGTGQFQVTRRMTALLDRLEAGCHPSRRPAIERHRRSLQAAIAAAHPVESDRAFASIADPQGIGGAARAT